MLVRDRLVRVGAVLAVLGYVVGWLVFLSPAGSTSAGYVMLGVVAICWAFLVPIVGTATVILKAVVDGMRLRRRQSEQKDVVMRWLGEALLVLLPAGIMYGSAQQVTMPLLPLLPVGAAALCGLVAIGIVALTTGPAPRQSVDEPTEKGI